MLWIISAVIWGIVDFFYMFDLLVILYKAKGRGQAPSPPDWTYHTIHITSYWMLLYICSWLRDPEPSTVIMGYAETFMRFSWIPVYLYVIIRDKLSQKKSWREYCLEKIAWIFNIFLRIRYYIRYGCHWLKRIMRYSLFWCIMRVLFVLLLLVLIFGTQKINQTMYIRIARCAGILFISYMVFNRFIKALSSCCSLLIAWGMLILIAFVVQGAFLFLPLSGLYCFWVILLCVFWLLLGGTADYEVTKMASLIINTFTTIFVIASNVLVGWLSTFPEFQTVSSDVWQSVQYAANLIVLPFIAAGYLTALLNEIQVYWEEWHADLLPEKEKCISVSEPLFRKNREKKAENEMKL